jgi:peptidoglycan/LPS O-acetylase OafA/YrhL
MPPGRDSTRTLRSSADTGGYLPTLDGWRAIAIALVMIDHAFNSTVCGVGSTRWCNALKVGQTGVNLFFGISGYLITCRLLRERDLTGQISRSAFYIRRVFRILPAAVTYLAGVALLAACGLIVVSRGELFGSLFFYRNYLGPQAGFYTNHFWSLSVEEHFYILWPSLLIVLCLWVPRRAAVVTFGSALAIVAWRQVVLLHSVIVTGAVARNFNMRTDVRLDALLLGASAALALWTSPALRRFVDAVGIGWWWCVAAIYVVVAAHFGLRPTVWEGALVPALLVWTVAHPSSAVGRILELPALRWVGRVSYSLYVWQQFFFPPWTIALATRRAGRARVRDRELLSDRTSDGQGRPSARGTRRARPQAGGRSSNRTAATGHRCTHARGRLTGASDRPVPSSIGRRGACAV